MAKLRLPKAIKSGNEHHKNAGPGAMHAHSHELTHRAIDKGNEETHFKRAHAEVVASGKKKGEF